MRQILTGEMGDSMSDAEKLARAVLMFHRGGRWTSEDHGLWLVLTGSSEATTKALGDFARRIIEKESPGL